MVKNDIFQITDHQNRDSYCEINLLGGGIMNLYLNRKHVLYAGLRPDGGQAFTHPCIPNFNIAKDLPNHGPARKELWKKEDNHTISWEMKEISGVYPAGIKATRKFSINQNTFSVSTAIENIGKETLPTNIAEHNYFACPIDKVKEVKVNGKAFHQEALKANAQFNHWQDENILEIPQLGKIKFNTQGYKAFAQWSQPKASFACIEPIEIMPPESDKFMKQSPSLMPDEKKIFSYTIMLDN